MLLFNIITLLLAALFSIIIIWKGSSLLESKSEKLASYYNLPPIVQGAVIAAVGSSFPELSSTIISTLVHGKFELGVAAITGSAIFNILIIPGLSGIFAQDTLKSNRDLVYKEAQFYMIAVSILLIVFSFAVIYNPVENPHISGTVTRKLALFPILFYLIYIFIQYQDTMDYSKEQITEIDPKKEWALLILSLIVILIGVEGLVRSAVKTEKLFNIPSFFWGLTIIAGGTSVSDMFVSVEAARKGKEITSIANTLGSNIFDLLVAIPAGVLIAGETIINFSRAVPLLAFLIFATIILFAFIRTSLEITKKESYALIGLYFIFLGWMILETIGVVSYVL